MITSSRALRQMDTTARKRMGTAGRASLNTLAIVPAILKMLMKLPEPLTLPLWKLLTAVMLLLF
ncbi:MAG TPA: hypothetical protein VK864_00655 [Longimicrobiales bacterium]|nr:hypothetical protein [Longimicrobiales bacterium]